MQSVQTTCQPPTMIVTVAGMVGEGVELTFLSPAGQLRGLHDALARLLVARDARRDARRVQPLRVD